jgi:hypothetical protein
LRHALLTISKHDDSRKCLVLLGAILETPGLVDRLLQVLKPEAADGTADRKAAAERRHTL